VIRIARVDLAASEVALRWGEDEALGGEDFLLVRPCRQASILVEGYRITSKIYSATYSLESTTHFSVVHS